MFTFQSIFHHGAGRRGFFRASARRGRTAELMVLALLAPAGVVSPLFAQPAAGSQAETEQAGEAQEAQPEGEAQEAQPEGEAQGQESEPEAAAHEDQSEATAQEGQAPGQEGEPEGASQADQEGEQDASQEGAASGEAAPAAQSAPEASEAPGSQQSHEAEEQTAERAGGADAAADSPEQEPVKQEAAEQQSVGREGAEESRSPAAEPEAGPARSNPRPEGEEELLGRHPMKETNSYKPGTGAMLESQDGLFAMGIRARVQIRDELEFSEEQVDDGMGGTTTDSQVENTFGIRRARLQLKGHVFGKDNKYKAEFAFSPRDLGYDGNTVSRTPLLSYYVEFVQLRDLSLRLGQYKLYYSRQRVISSGNQEFVDRTAAQGEFNLDRDVGGHFFSKDLGGLGLFKYYAGITVGEGRDVWLAEDFNDGYSAGAQYLARFEVLPFGHFDDYSEVDFARLDRLRMSIGGAYAFLDNGTQVAGYQGDAFEDGGTVDYHNAAADVLFKYAGLTGLLEFYWRSGERDVAPTPGDTGNLPRNGLGGTVQLGYLLPGLPVGVGARYSGLGPDGGAQESALPSEHEAGATVGWYMAGHPLKLQADYFHLWGDAYTGGAADRIRVQLQVAY